MVVVVVCVWVGVVWREKFISSAEIIEIKLTNWRSSNFGKRYMCLKLSIAITGRSWRGWGERKKEREKLNVVHTANL